MGGASRELDEEVAVEEIRSLTCAAVLNENNGGVSDTTPAWSCLLETGGEVTVRETEKMAGECGRAWKDPGEYHRLETWSQIVVDCLLDPQKKI